jgi:hypothetical protein
MNIKTFEQYNELDPYNEEKWDDDDDSGVVLNLKAVNGKLLRMCLAYAVTTPYYQQGNPPMVQSIAKGERTKKQKECLKLAEY